MKRSPYSPATTDAANAARSKRMTPEAMRVFGFDHFRPIGNTTEVWWRNDALIQHTFTELPTVGEFVAAFEDAAFEAGKASVINPIREALEL